MRYFLRKITTLCVASLLINSSMLIAGSMAEEITKAQPKLATAPLTITTRDGQTHKFTVELAKTDQEQEIGEMFRKTIPEGTGMLFLWKHLQESDMWMRNTYVSLDMLFIDAKQRVHAIEEKAIPFSEAVIRSNGPVKSVLELPAGTAEKLGIVVGDSVKSAAFEAKTGD